MRNFIKAFKVYILALAIIAGAMSNTTIAFASYSSVSSVAKAYGPGGTLGNTSWPSELADYFTTEKPVGAFKTVKLGDTTYYYQTDKSDAIIGIGDSLDKAAQEHLDAEASDQQSVENFKDVTKEMNITADIKTASGALSGFTGIVNTFLGVVVVVSTLGITAFTGLDVCYIIFPVLQNKCEESRQSGGAFAGKTTADGDTKLKWVSDDAVYALKTANTVESGKNPLIIYGKKRALMIIVLGVVNFIFLTGRLSILTDIALNLTDGILRIIQSI